MGQTIKVGYKQLLIEAEREIETLGAAESIPLLQSSQHVFIDIRDIRELDQVGRIPGAIHAPRGMLEFWVDPDSPYHRDIFDQDKSYIFFCAGGWRSALAALQMQKMGLSPVAHIEGGFGAWQEAGGPVELTSVGMVRRE
ncbi:MAG: rhodanese-like domain-containing protein [Cohaesibacter sp.]|jgi:rhodanese-related sulfurtransferase|nr:rhodanese-like domain-containing protein [Cohaesibacter sp.]